MATILIAGLINVETTLAVDGFPIDYAPVRYPFFGVNSRVAGVGYNLACALTVLGHEVRLLALLGRDPLSALVAPALAADGIADGWMVPALTALPQSLVCFERSGRRAVFTDLKDIQEVVYPLGQFTAALVGCDLAVLTNIQFARPFLAIARAQGVPIVCDVHAIADLEDAYNRDFMAAATMLFQSHERLPCAPVEWAVRVQERYAAELVVIGMGDAGALLAQRGGHPPLVVPSIVTRPVVNTVGAGDALCAAFVDGWLRGKNPVDALRRATVFASYKVGVDGAAQGFLRAADLDAWCQRVGGWDDGAR